MLEIYTKVMLLAKKNLMRIKNDERGEGMVGWILATMLVVTIVVILHGAITGWLPGLWTKIQQRVESIV
jgi:FlaG/FlaF family flagellin (archaellin)